MEKSSLIRVEGVDFKFRKADKDTKKKNLGGTPYFTFLREGEAPSGRESERRIRRIYATKGKRLGGEEGGQ